MQLKALKKWEASWDNTLRNHYISKEEHEQIVTKHNAEIKQIFESFRNLVREEFSENNLALTIHLIMRIDEMEKKVK